METLNRNRISHQEMDELIGLAEKVSVNIENVKDKIKIKYAYIVIYCVLASLIVLLIISGMLGQFFNIIFGSIITVIILKLLGAITTGAFIGLTLLKFEELVRIKSTINTEKIVLKKLLNMIEGYKDLYFEDEYGNNSRVISKALFEMRLSRINFKVK